MLFVFFMLKCVQYNIYVNSVLIKAVSRLHFVCTFFPSICYKMCAKHILRTCVYVSIVYSKNDANEMMKCIIYTPTITTNNFFLFLSHDFYRSRTYLRIYIYLFSVYDWFYGNYMSKKKKSYKNNYDCVCFFGQSIQISVSENLRIRDIIIIWMRCCRRNNLKPRNFYILALLIRVCSILLLFFYTYIYIYTEDPSEIKTVTKFLWSNYFHRQNTIYVYMFIHMCISFPSYRLISR